MKKIILVICLALSLGLTNAQKTPFLISSDDFQANTKGKSPLGYANVSLEIGEDEFMAMYKKASDFVILRLFNLEHFNQHKTFSKNSTQHSGIYQLENCNAVYFQKDGVSILYLELLGINASVEVSAKKPLSKIDMEKIIAELGVIKWKNSNKANWPSEISVAQQIEGVIMSIEKKDPSTDGFIYEYHVKVQYSQKLIQSIEHILAKYGGGIDLVNMDKFTFICASTDSMDALKKEFKEGSEVNFIYYKKQ
jgi:hypothetical protein